MKRPYTNHHSEKEVHEHLISESQVEETVHKQSHFTI